MDRVASARRAILDLGSEDYYHLCDAAVYLPSVPEVERVAVARLALRQLIAEGLVQLSLGTWSNNAFTPVPTGQVEAVLNDPVAWAAGGLLTGPVYVFSNTDRGDEVSRTGANARAAVVLGASGSVGGALVRELIRNGSFKPIVTLVRRSQPDQVALARDAGIELRETLVPAMDPAGLETAIAEAIRSLEGDVVGMSVLGIGAGTAKRTIDEHRAIDVQLNAAFARGLKASGRVRHLAFMSAAGADPTAAASGSGAAGMARYARVKGEAEEAVKESGPAVVSIFRPGMIIGSRHTPWLLEKVLPVFSFVTPPKYKSITVEQIAKAMIATSLNAPAKSDVYHYPEMMALNR